MRRWICVLLAAVLSLGLFSGCKKAEEGSPADSFAFLEESGFAVKSTVLDNLPDEVTGEGGIVIACYDQILYYGVDQNFYSDNAGVIIKAVHVNTGEVRELYRTPPEDDIHSEVTFSHYWNDGIVLAVCHRADDGLTDCEAFWLNWEGERQDLYSETGSLFSPVIQIRGNSLAVLREDDTGNELLLVDLRSGEHYNLARGEYETDEYGLTTGNYLFGVSDSFAGQFYYGVIACDKEMLPSAQTGAVYRSSADGSGREKVLDLDLPLYFLQGDDDYILVSERQDNDTQRILGKLYLPGDNGKWEKHELPGVTAGSEIIDGKRMGDSVIFLSGGSIYRYNLNAMTYQMEKHDTSSWQYNFVDDSLQYLTMEEGAVILTTYTLK